MRKKRDPYDKKLSKPKAPDLAGSSLRGILYTYGLLMSDYMKLTEEKEGLADGSASEVNPEFRMGSRSMVCYMLQYIHAAFIETFGDEDLFGYLMLDLATIINKGLEKVGCSLPDDRVPASE